MSCGGGVTEDALARARREERALLARELHDSVVQRVFSMRLQAKALRARANGDGGDEAVARIADELLTLSGATLDELRDVVAGLRQAEPGGLAERLRADADAVRAATGLAVSVEGRAEFPPGIADDVYRIAREALHNAVKHANATRVTIALGDREVEVVDDGVGLPPEELRGPGLGLVSMRERAERCGGTLHIDSDAHGTRVRLRLAPW